MKDSLDILCTGDYVEHHGVKGMKWGRRKNVTTGTGNSRTASGKIQNLVNNNKGVHKRGNGLYNSGGEIGGKKGYGPVGVAGGSYGFGAEKGDIVTSGKMSEKDLVELHNKTIDDVRKSPYYSEIFKLAEELKNMAESRRQNINGRTASTELVFEAKADKIVKQINEKLKSLDDTYASETAKIRNFKRDFSPSKWVLSDLSERKSVSAALGLNRSTGRVDKGWNRPSPVPKSAKGYTFERKKPWEK